MMLFLVILFLFLYYYWATLDRWDTRLLMGTRHWTLGGYLSDGVVALSVVSVACVSCRWALSMRW